jgi:hypothetical protein
LARAEARAAREAAQVAAAADAERARLARAAKSRARAQLAKQKRQAAKDQAEAEDAAVRMALDNARAQAIFEAQDAGLAAKLAAAQAAARCGPGTPLCRDSSCLKPLTPTPDVVQRCQENGWPLPTRCWPHRLARQSAFARRLRDSAAGPGGGGSGGTDPAHLSATVANPARPQADYSSNGESRTPHVAVAEDAGQPNAPMSRPGEGDWGDRYPAGYGDEPPPDFLGRRSWHLISAYVGGAWPNDRAWPKAGELWRFLVDATPGSSRTEDMRWIEVRILPGQEQFLFAARPELRIPGTAPMTYVDDPTPTKVTYWIDSDEGGPIEGHDVEAWAPPRLVRDAWGRTPEQAAAAERGGRPGYVA